MAKDCAGWSATWDTKSDVIGLISDNGSVRIRPPALLDLRHWTGRKYGKPSQGVEAHDVGPGTLTQKGLPRPPRAA